MTVKKNQTQKRQRRIPVVLTSLTAWMLTNHITPSECFSGVQQPPSRTSVSQQHGIPLRYTSDASLPDVLTQFSTVTTAPAASSSHGLANAMRRSQFTAQEIQQLTTCVQQQAASGDSKLQQRTFDFIQLLTETTELGLPALMAAAYHFADRRPEDSSSALAIWSSAERLRLLEHKATAVAPNDFGAIRHLLLTEMDDWRALAIRLAVCLFTMDRDSAKAALSVYAPLASRLGMYRLKNELQNSAFRMRYPRQYEAVHALRPSSDSMESVLERVRTEMTELLQNDEEFSSQVESFEVAARVKEPYSMHKKMLQKKLTSFRQVPDALALRIVLQAKSSDDEHIDVRRGRERALCYYAQQLCLERWKAVPNDPRFRDYIGNPKRNGYQSLHYTAMIGNDWMCEVQSRSADMHRTAEFGPASHCEYKERTTTTTTASCFAHNNQSIPADTYWRHRYPTASVQQTPLPCDDRTTSLRPYLEALAQTKSEVAHSAVVVFLKQHNSEDAVLRLPVGACVWDALRSYRDGAKATLNGESTPVTRQLHNGDVLELLAV